LPGRSGSYHIYPNEVIDEIRRRGIATLKGNHDEKVENITTIPHSLTEPGKKYAYHLIQVEFRRIEYDVEASVKAIEESLLSNEFAEVLRQAK